MVVCNEDEEEVGERCSSCEAVEIHNGCGGWHSQINGSVSAQRVLQQANCLCRADVEGFVRSVVRKTWDRYCLDIHHQDVGYF